MTPGPTRSTVADKREAHASAVTLLRRLTNAFERHGWRNEGEMAYELVETFLRKGRGLSSADLDVVPTAFYANNGTTKKQLLAVANKALRSDPR